MYRLYHSVNHVRSQKEFISNTLRMLLNEFGAKTSFNVFKRTALYVTDASSVCVLDLKGRCADRSVFDIKVLQ